MDAGVSYIVSIAHDVFALGKVLIELWTNSAILEKREKVHSSDALSDTVDSSIPIIKLANNVEVTWHEFYFSHSGMSEWETTSVYMPLVEAMEKMIVGTVEMRRDLLATVATTFEKCLHKVIRWAFVPYATKIPPPLHGRFQPIRLPIVEP